MRFGLFIALLSLLLSGCASGGPKLSFSFFKTYAAVQKDFEQGRIMEARAKVLGMDKSREDYPQALRFLKTKIEPARKRLLRHYSQLAERHEKAGEWYQAMQAYEQAAGFSTRPAALQKKRAAMELRFRQVRMEALLKQRRQQDTEWLAHQDDFEPPKGVPANDEVFVRKRKQFQDDLEERADRAYDEARRYLRKGYPAVAYIEIESHLRLDPDSEAGKKLKAEIMQALPKGLKIPPLKVNWKSPAIKRIALPKKVSASQIRALMKKGQWLEARRYALVYRRQGGRDAKKLLNDIQQAMASEAEDKYRRGSFYYRKEKLDRAIELWSEAAALAPENVEYREALRRARQLKERLDLLRKAAGEDEKPASQGGD